MPFIWWERKALYCRKKQDAIGEKMEVKGPDPHLRCKFLDKPHTSHCVTHSGLYRTLMLELEFSQRTAVLNALCVSCHHLELFAVPLRERHWYYIQVKASWRKLETHCMLCVRRHQYLLNIRALLGKVVNRSVGCFAKRQLRRLW